jgi:hypothetical protein
MAHLRPDHAFASRSVSSSNEDRNAKDGELSENKVWSLGRANFD